MLGNSTESPDRHGDSKSPEYSGHTLLIATSVLLGVQAICVIIRFSLRYTRKVPYGLDDYVVFLALLGQVGWGVVIIGTYNHTNQSLKL